MEQKAWIDGKSARFPQLQPIQHIGVMESDAKPELSPTHRYFNIISDTIAHHHHSHF
jgi:hypothetical protein